MIGTTPRVGGNFYSRFLNPNAAPLTLTLEPNPLMTHFSQLPLADFLGLGGAEIGIIFAVVGMVFGGVMGLAGMYFHHQRQRLWHETARIALERGQPVPPRDSYGSDDDDKTDGTKNRANHDVRGGLVLIAVGAGLWLMLGGIAGNLRYVGAIPGFIGVALLLYALLAAVFGRKNPPQNPSPRP